MTSNLPFARTFQTFVKTHFGSNGYLQTVITGKSLYQFVMKSGQGVSVHIKADGVIFRSGMSVPSAAISA